jgi:membrane protein
MVTYAAALAYHFLFALFPFLLFLVALLGFLQIPEFFDWILDQARLALPADAYTLIEETIRNVEASQSGGLLSIGIAIALWSASTGVRALMNALNSAYDVPETRATWKRYLYSLLLTVGFAALLIAAGVLLVFGPQAVEWLAGFFGMGDLFVTVWSWLRWPVIVLLLMMTAALVYYYVPNIDQQFRLITPGAVLAVLVWIVASLGFSFYVSNFANYDATYGSIGGIIVMMLYFFISSNVLLAGAELNAEIYHLKKGRAVPDDTSGAGQLSPELRGARKPESGAR